jgi:hypothetical protein
MLGRHVQLPAATLLLGAKEAIPSEITNKPSSVLISSWST